MWQLGKQICKKKSEATVVKKNEKGELVTESSQLKKLYETTYKKQLEHRKMKPELSRMYELKMELFSLRFEVCKNIKSDDWSEDNLTNVLKRIKRIKVQIITA